MMNYSKIKIEHKEIDNVKTGIILLFYILNFDRSGI